MLNINKYIEGYRKFIRKNKASILIELYRNQNLLFTDCPKYIENSSRKFQGIIVKNKGYLFSSIPSNIINYVLGIYTPHIPVGHVLDIYDQKGESRNSLIVEDDRFIVPYMNGTRPIPLSITNFYLKSSINLSINEVYYFGIIFNKPIELPESYIEYGYLDSKNYFVFEFMEGSQVFYRQPKYVDKEYLEVFHSAATTLSNAWRRRKKRKLKRWLLLKYLLKLDIFPIEIILKICLYVY